MENVQKKMDSFSDQPEVQPFSWITITSIHKEEIVCPVKLVHFQVRDVNTERFINLELNAAIISDLKDNIIIGCDIMKDWIINLKEGYVIGKNQKGTQFRSKCYLLHNTPRLISELKSKELIDIDHIQDQVFLIQMEGLKNDNDFENALKIDPIVQEAENEFGAHIRSIIQKEYPEIINPRNDLPPVRPEFDMKIDLKDEYLKDKVIKPSSVLTSFPIVAVAKPDGSLRMCVDYRLLNKITYSDGYQLPNTADILNECHGYNLFSKMDLLNGFHQLRLKDESSTAISKEDDSNNSNIESPTNYNKGNNDNNNESTIAINDKNNNNTNKRSWRI
ncbi:hypothetical protein ACTA71_001031 [Dictyostelium dimigraforme]